MKSKSNRLKGMSLYEIIISLAIFTIMCGVLVGIGLNIDSTSRATTNFKRKIVAESPYAANHLKEYNDVSSSTNVPLVTETFDINVQITGIQVEIGVTELTSSVITNGGTSTVTSWYQYQTNAGGAIVSSTVDDPSVVMTGVHYKTKDVYLNGKSAEQIADEANKANAALDIDFYEAEVTIISVSTTAAPVTTTTT